MKIFYLLLLASCLPLAAEIPHPIVSIAHVEIFQVNDLNGFTVNQVYDVFPAGGRILFQNEGHEVFFRNAILEPAKK